MDTFGAFIKNVQESLDGHAKRKGYSAEGADGKNKMAMISHEMGFSPGHELGEILYKLAEFREQPRRVIMEKIAAWAFLLWRQTSA